MVLTDQDAFNLTIYIYGDLTQDGNILALQKHSEVTGDLQTELELEKHSEMP